MDPPSPPFSIKWYYAFKALELPLLNIGLIKDTEDKITHLGQVQIQIETGLV